MLDCQTQREILFGEGPAGQISTEHNEPKKQPCANYSSHRGPTMVPLIAGVMTASLHSAAQLQVPLRFPDAGQFNP